MPTLKRLTSYIQWQRRDNLLIGFSGSKELLYVGVQHRSKVVILFVRQQADCKYLRLTEKRLTHHGIMVTTSSVAAITEQMLCNALVK